MITGEKDQLSAFNLQESQISLVSCKLPGNNWRKQKLIKYYHSKHGRNPMV